MLKTLARVPKIYWLVIAIALLTAFINAKFRLDSFLQVVIPWTIIAFAIPFFASTKRDALKLSGIFGFVASYSFLWFDNSSPMTLTKILLLIPFILLPALFGLLCGALLGYCGWTVKKIFIK